MTHLHLPFMEERNTSVETNDAFFEALSSSLLSEELPARTEAKQQLDTTIDRKEPEYSVQRTVS